MTKKKLKKQPEFPDVPYVVETFRKPEHYSVSNAFDAPAWREPDVINGVVRVRRYRVVVTVEEIQEPPEVIHERLIKLWRQSRNFHHYGPIRDVADAIGLELNRDDFGADEVKVAPGPKAPRR